MWWFGSAVSDVLAQNKLMWLGISVRDLKIMNTEGVIERFVDLLSGKFIKNVREGM